METIIIIALSAVIVALILLLWRTRVVMSQRTEEADNRIAKSRQQAISQSRAVLGGHFMEQMTPYLPEFSYDPTEARFIGSPIDLIVFPGLSQDAPTEIVIMEVKSGKRPRLTSREKRIQELVEMGKVRFELIHRPQE